MITRKSKHEFRVYFADKSAKDLHTMKDWCKESFGAAGKHDTNRWRYGWFSTEKDVFYFRSEKDALHFALRWA